MGDWLKKQRDCADKLNLGGTRPHYSYDDKKGLFKATQEPTGKPRNGTQYIFGYHGGNNRNTGKPDKE